VGFHLSQITAARVRRPPRRSCSGPAAKPERGQRDGSHDANQLRQGRQLDRLPGWA
jgi:hypothetical protein